MPQLLSKARAIEQDEVGVCPILLKEVALQDRHFTRQLLALGVIIPSHFEVCGLGIKVLQELDSFDFPKKASQCGRD